MTHHTTTPQGISKTATALFASLIDYAGLFPPAALPLEQALNNYRSYLDHPQRWILSRFILTPAHLEKISPALAELFSPQRPLDLSLVSKAPVAEIPAAMERIAALNSSAGVDRAILGAVSDRAMLGAVELPLATEGSIRTQIAACNDLLQRYDSAGTAISAFFELPACADWDARLHDIVEALRAAAASSKRLLGFKLRCGGTEPHLIPSPPRVAHAIATCAALRVPIKFTAGLHYPFQHGMTKETSACGAQSMHGYFNVFFAAFAAHSARLTPQALVDILLGDGSVAPRLSDEAIEWCGIRVPLAELAALRTSQVISFGSCSFTEPLEEAAKRGWL